jgi:predicted nucleic acid-binding protein
MKHFFLDTNILLDFLTDRKPFSEQAAILFQMSKENQVKLYVAAISFNNIYYIVRQVQTHAKTIELLKGLAQLVEIIAVDETVLQQALNSDFKDFEDSIQSYAAESITEIDGIVTRNQKDFKKSSLPILAPDNAMALLNM